MSSGLRSAVKQIVPTKVVNLLRPPQVTFEFGFGSWAEAQASSTGYDFPAIADRVLRATQKVIAGEAAFERDGTNFDEIQYSYPALAGLCRAAASGSMRVLDFGGALGGTYLAHREVLPPDTEWAVVEQATYVDLAQEFLNIEELNFYQSLEECSGQFHPNVVLLSGVIQYMEDPFDVLDAIVAVDSVEWIVFDRVSCSDSGSNEIALQRVRPPLGDSSYPVWFFDERELVDHMQHEFSLLFGFDSFERWTVGRRTLQNRGWVFRRSTRS
jgi:putative methyltransferase (TIGR04325 family)